MPLRAGTDPIPGRLFSSANYFHFLYTMLSTCKLLARASVLLHPPINLACPGRPPNLHLQPPRRTHATYTRG